MKLIAHRGNINGPNKNQENNPEYILNAIKQGYYVELDLWLVDNKLYLGHDFPKYEINRNFLTDIKEKLFCHCKNISALHYILKNNQEIECFYHTNDDCVLTSKGNIWNHYKTLEFTSKSICVMPELCNYNIVDNNIIGVCSDYVKSYK